MYRVYKNGSETDSKLVEYIADTEADIAELPTNNASGSICLVIQGDGDSGAAVYALGNDKIWHKL